LVNNANDSKEKRPEVLICHWISSLVQRLWRICLVQVRVMAHSTRSTTKASAGEKSSFQTTWCSLSKALKRRMVAKSRGVFQQISKSSFQWKNSSLQKSPTFRTSKTKAATSASI